MRASELGRGLGLALCIAFIAGPAAAACIAPPLSPEFVNQFKSNPGQLIPSPDTDARAVEATARDLAGTDPALAQELVQIAKGARPRFKAAIAAGLAQAALACMSIDQQAALQIQQSVASFPDGQFQALFAAVVGDLSTAATAAAEFGRFGFLRQRRCHQSQYFACRQDFAGRGWQHGRLLSRRLCRHQSQQCEGRHTGLGRQYRGQSSKCDTLGPVPAARCSTAGRSKTAYELRQPVSQSTLPAVDPQWDGSAGGSA